MTNKKNCETALEDKVEDSCYKTNLDMFKPLYHEITEKKDNSYIPAKKNFYKDFIRHNPLKDCINVFYTAFSKI